MILTLFDQQNTESGTGWTASNYLCISLHTMYFLKSVLLATLLFVGVLSAKKSSTERFSNYHAKSLSSSPLKLSEASYKTLTSTPRDYSVAVLLTALETRFNCQLCREFQPEYELLGKSWTKGDSAAESRTLFGYLEFVDGRDVFLSVWPPNLIENLLLQKRRQILTTTFPTSSASKLPQCCFSSSQPKDLTR